jgi:hypothetical protein
LAREQGYPRALLWPVKLLATMSNKGDLLWLKTSAKSVSLEL